MTDEQRRIVYLEEKLSLAMGEIAARDAEIERQTSIKIAIGDELIRSGDRIAKLEEAARNVVKTYSCSSSSADCGCYVCQLEAILDAVNDKGDR